MFFVHVRMHLLSVHLVVTVHVLYSCDHRRSKAGVLVGRKRRSRVVARGKVWRLRQELCRCQVRCVAAVLGSKMSELKKDSLEIQ